MKGGRLPPKLQQQRQQLMLLLLVAVALSSSMALFIYRYNSSTETRIVHARTTTTRHYSYRDNKNVPSLLAAPLFPPPPTTTTRAKTKSGPYHNWALFSMDFLEMLRHFKIFAYPDISNTTNPFANIFLPYGQNPFHNPRLGNYFSEHIFKISLLNSSFTTLSPQKAHFFYLPFSVNILRNDPRVHSELKISEFVAKYVSSIGLKFRFWNASGGADHFYVCCHSVCRHAMSKHHGLLNNAVQVTCSSSYFQRYYISHKDVGLPQIWPRSNQTALNSPHTRHRLVYFAGRVQNSQVRRQLIDLLGNDTELDIFNGSSTLSYEEGFQKSKYCLHVKGYEVNTARVSDAIHYGCIPVIISNYYDLPFANVLDWSKFSVFINQRDIALLKATLLGITSETYLIMYHNLCKIRRHFVWHMEPRGYDAFHMTLYQLWLRRSVHRLSLSLSASLDNIN